MLAVFDLCTQKFSSLVHKKDGAKLYDIFFAEIWILWFLLGFGTGQESGFFLGSVFWSVFLCQLEESGGWCFIKTLGELIDHWWDLQSLLEYGTLSLKTDVFWPSDESGQITFWLDILSCKCTIVSIFSRKLDFLAFFYQFIIFRMSYIYGKIEAKLLRKFSVSFLTKNLFGYNRVQNNFESDGSQIYFLRKIIENFDVLLNFWRNYQATRKNK